MKTTPVIVLAVAAVAAIAAAAFVARSQRAETPSDSAARAPMFEGLGDRLKDVAAITVKHADKELTVSKSDKGWGVADKGGYPAKPEEVKKVLVGLSQLQRTEAMTAKPDRYAKLGVQDPDGKAASEPGATTPTLVTFKDDKGQPVASAIVGMQKWSGNTRGVYIRKSGDPQSWLTQGELDVPTEATRWIDSTILQIPRDRIKGVTVTQPVSGETLALSRANAQEQNFTVHDLPKGKELKSPSEPGAVADALVSLTLDDVSPAAAVDLSEHAGAKPGAYSEFRTFDGLVIACQLAEKDGKTWAKFTANYEAPPAADTPKPDPTNPEAKAPDAKPGEKKPEEVQKEVADLNAKLGPWAFVLPQYKAQILQKKLDELIKTDQPPPPPPAMEGTQPLFPPGVPGSTGPGAPIAPTGAPAPTLPKPIPTPTLPAPTGATGPASGTGAPAATGSTGTPGTPAATGSPAATGTPAPTGTPGPTGDT